MRLDRIRYENGLKTQEIPGLPGSRLATHFVNAAAYVFWASHVKECEPVERADVWAFGVVSSFTLIVKR